MSDQLKPGAVISLETAASEFSRAYGATIAKLVTEKLELMELNSQLTAFIDGQKKTIAQLEREVELINSRPKKQPEPDRVTWDK